MTQSSLTAIESSTVATGAPAVAAHPLSFPVEIRIEMTELATAEKSYDIADIALADDGQRRIEWANRQMPVLAQIRERFASERPVDGTIMACCLHVTTETANVVRALGAGGAEVARGASNALATEDA